MALEEGEKIENSNINEEIYKLLNEQKKKIDELERQLKSGKVGPANTDNALLKELVATLKNPGEEAISIQTGITLDQIPEEDFDEVGTIFCAPFFGYVATDYIKRGHRIVPPYGLRSIYFEQQASRRKREGKEEQIYHISMYTSHSKKLTQWLKEHPAFNFAFYQSMKAVENLDARRAARAATLFNMAKSLDAPKVIKMCTQHGVPKNDDIETMRSALVSAMIAKEEQEEKALVASRMTEIQKEKMLIGKNY